jgi:hypothetical protein
MILSFCLVACGLPSDQDVKREFVAQSPNTEVTHIELIFEQDNNVVYLISFKEKSSQEIRKQVFAMRYIKGKWQSCDDRTDRKCK